MGLNEWILASFVYLWKPRPWAAGKHRKVTESRCTSETSINIYSLEAESHIQTHMRTQKHTRIHATVTQFALAYLQLIARPSFAPPWFYLFLTKRKIMANVLIIWLYDYITSAANLTHTLSRCLSLGWSVIYVFKRKYKTKSNGWNELWD